MHAETLTLKVVARDELAAEVIGLTLASGDGTPLPPWTAGAHIDLVLDNDQVRQYSLCGDPDDRSCYRIAVLREQAGRGGSRRIHDRIHAGNSVLVRGPRNHFELVDSPRYLFIAGGIGITPILPMIAAAEAASADWQCVYGGRSRATMAFSEQLSTYGARVRFWPQDENGLIDLDRILGAPHEGTQVYCCGPEPLLTAVRDRCRHHGWPAQSLYVEHFAPASSGGLKDDLPFEVELARSGRTVTVPAERSVLEVLEDVGVCVPSSCGVGTCGTCETIVLDGEPDHRDSVLSEHEKTQCNFMMICVSRARTSRLVLDL